MAKKKEKKIPELLTAENWTALSYLTAACNRDVWHEAGSYPKTVQNGSLMLLMDGGLAQRRRDSIEDPWQWKATPAGVEFARSKGLRYDGKPIDEAA